MDLQWIVAPLVGSVIGLFTNWLAIKMLFRPFKPVYIGKWHVPLTPGMIPKGKGRLALAVGDSIAQTLLSQETIKEALLSDEMREKLSDTIDDLLENGKQDERTLRELTLGVTGEDALSKGEQDVKALIVTVLTGKLSQMRLGDLAAQAIVDHVKKKAPSALSGLVSGVLDDRIKASIMGQLSDGVNNYIDENAQEILQGAIDAEADKLMGARLCDLIAQYGEDVSRLKQRLMAAYQGLIEMGTGRVLGAIDLSAIVEQRIMGFEDREMEALILGVVSRELNAVVMLGGVLGFLMGFTNLLFR